MRNARKAEPELVDDLLSASRPEQVQDVCKRSASWFKPEGFVGASLCHFAEELVREIERLREKKRLPRSDRPTSRGRREAQLSRIMAALSMGIGGRRGIDLLQKHPFRINRLPLCRCGHIGRQHGRCNITAHVGTARCSCSGIPVCNCNHPEHVHTACPYCTCQKFVHGGGWLDLKADNSGDPRTEDQFVE